MSSTVYFITGNSKKFEEAKSILPNLKQLDMDLPEIQDIDAEKIIGAKLLEAMKHKKAEFIVEDTSLYMDCLNGLPGPLIKWFMETIGNDGLYKIAEKFGNTAAEAKTIIGYAKSPSELHFFKGSVKGRIVPPRAKSDFGWDPIFEPEGSGRSFAEMTREEKNSVSMRRIALDRLKEFLGAKTAAKRGR